MRLKRKQRETWKERSVLNGGLFKRIFFHSYHSMRTIRLCARLGSEMGSSVGHELFIYLFVITCCHSPVNLDFKERGKSNNKERLSFLTKHQSNSLIVFHKCLVCRWNIQKIDLIRVLKSMCVLRYLLMI